MCVGGNRDYAWRSLVFVGFNDFKISSQLKWTEIINGDYISGLVIKMGGKQSHADQIITTRKYFRVFIIDCKMTKKDEFVCRLCKKQLSYSAMTDESEDKR